MLDRKCYQSDKQDIPKASYTLLCFAAGISQICWRFSVDPREGSRWRRRSSCAGEDSSSHSLLAYSDVPTAQMS